MTELADDVRVEPTRGGFLAHSDRWRVAATGETAEEAIGQLAEVILLSRELDRRVSAARETSSVA